MDAWSPRAPIGTSGKLVGLLRLLLGRSDGFRSFPVGAAALACSEFQSLTPAAAYLTISGEALDEGDLPIFYAELREHMALEDLHEQLKRENEERKTHRGKPFKSKISTASHEWYVKLRKEAESNPDEDQEAKPDGMNEMPIPDPD